MVKATGRFKFDRQKFGELSRDLVDRIRALPATDEDALLSAVGAGLGEIFEQTLTIEVELPGGGVDGA